MSSYANCDSKIPENVDRLVFKDGTGVIQFYGSDCHEEFVDDLVQDARADAIMDGWCPR